MRVRVTLYLSEIIAYTSIAMQMIITKFHHPRRYVIAVTQVQLAIVMPMIIDQFLTLFIIIIYILFFYHNTLLGVLPQRGSNLWQKLS